jgi:hypothetical protein
MSWSMSALRQDSDPLALLEVYHRTVDHVRGRTP